jgi:cation diffusion facilitator CzcD-associated flavoprotein CzcO
MTTTKTGSFVLANHSIDYKRPIKVSLPHNDRTDQKLICIGAGINGIITAIRFPQKIQNLTLTVYEKNSDVGGTWFENTYPGVACDLPAHTYNLSFEPKRDWSSFYANGNEIFEYWRGVAKKYGAYRFIKFNSKYIGARWDDDRGKWTVQIERTENGGTEMFEDEADIMISCTGTEIRATDIDSRVRECMEIPGCSGDRGFRRSRYAYGELAT